MTDPATVGDLPTIDQARAIAGANDTRVVRRWAYQDIVETIGEAVRDATTQYLESNGLNQ